MRVSIPKLQDELHFEISIRAFNAMPFPVGIRQVSGRIRCSKTVDRKNTPLDDLPPPRLEYKAFLEDISPFAEFVFVLEQRVTSDIASEILGLSSDERLNLDLDDLNVMMISKRAPDMKWRLPLWDGMALYRDSTRIHVGHIINLTTKDAKKLGSTP